MSNPRDSDDKPKNLVIHIDKKRYDAWPIMTGAELRKLPNPDIGNDRDLWLEVPGGDDIRVADDKKVTIKNGMHFFTAPSKINPG